MSEILAFAAGLLVMYGVFFLAGLYARRVDAATAAATRERYRILDEQFERLVAINEARDALTAYRKERGL